ncbi:hypothetical protein K435DRAFT_836766 [Dendrothele bispora CBS 962.96]|uniref:P-loop containing nucleoside triphosphate hydrolase protein n=1 Tax=Dendrothele bispora (strain CBS 962.96) TaxID=1314807 RepID=A0A4S8MHE2_DENBC|nr:hypothetical protein K435DRAFT_836766 [Dendrothele bispora CBS 962.96]
MAGRGSRLLDALDSFSNPTPRTSMTPINVEVGPSSTPDASQSKMALMQARLTQEQGKLGFARHAESVDDDVDFVFGSQSGSSTSRAFPAGPKVAGGFRLNYDIETPVRSIDLGGADQEEKIAEFVTKGIDNASHGITVQRGMEALGLEDKEDILPGMDVRLLDHQAIGVAWMLEKERGQDRGGILADDMGLGKTVQMIATMAMNQPAIDEENTCKTTLIVVPAALLQQWKDEILEKTNGIWTVHVHHGKDKLKKKSEVKSFDMIVTTYHTLMNDFVIPKDVEPAEEAAWLAKNGGILARIKFYRAIADEAQYIRNRGTKASMALAHVQAKYRWMLTGTPVTNTLADIYGLLRFGKFRPWNDWNSFNEYVARVQVEDAPLAGQRAQTILSPILLRRTKDSQLEGKPILDLKPKVIELVRIPFSEDERDIYDSFEQSSKIQVNKFINEKSLVKNHHFVLVMILRLRQLCCHPHLILSQTEDYADPTVLMGGDGEKERARALKAKGKVWVDKVKQRLLIRARADNVFDFADELDDATCPVCDEAFVEDKGRILGCGHEVCSECVLDIRNSAIEHNGIFGEGNEKENMEIERKFEEANAKGWRPCPTCKSMQDLSEAKIFKLDAFQPTEEELAKFVAESRQARRKKTKKAVKYESSDDESEGGPTNKTLEEKGLDDSDDDFPELADIMRPMKKQKIEETKDNDDDEIVDLTLDQVSAPLKTPSHNSSSSNAKKRKSPGSTSKSKGRPKKGTDMGNDGPSDAIIAAWSKGDDDLEASAKMIKLIKYLKEWEAIGDKTIVYSQWTSMLDLIETLFSRHGVRSVRYDGKMDRISREHALAVFKRPDGPKVILISTRSGGVGLNLVAANRIVNMDLSWNYAAESQAYDRAHRIGQNKTVFVKRLVIENTIEDRGLASLLQLQEVKVGLAEAALGEGTGTKLKKLSMRDIKFLFGMTKKAPSQSQDQGSDDGEE